MPPLLFNTSRPSLCLAVRLSCRCIPGIETLVKDAGFEGATAAEERAESICPPWMRGGYLKDVESFDKNFFGLSTAEVRLGLCLAESRKRL